MYAPGGLYLPHFDALDPIDVRNQICLIQNIILRILLFQGFSKTANGTWVGNRIATAMFYVRLLHNYLLFDRQFAYQRFLKLSDLDGGATVFPNQGLATFPSRGSMAFWYDLKPNGLKAEQSLHGACPTLYGVKWGKSRHDYIGEIIYNTLEF